jgi:hypothetical protein
MFKKGAWKEIRQVATRMIGDSVGFALEKIPK